MKKLIFIYIVCLLTLNSCLNDNYEQPDQTIYGNLIDPLTGENVQSKSKGQLVIRLLEQIPDNPNPEPLDIQVQKDGTFRSDRIFTGTYKAFPYRGAFVYTGDTVEINTAINGGRIDFELTPLIRIDVSVRNRDITYKLNATEATGDLALKGVAAMYNSYDEVDETSCSASRTGSYNSLTSQSQIGVENTVTLSKMPVGENYIRVGARLSDTWNYSKIIKAVITEKDSLPPAVKFVGNNNFSPANDSASFIVAVFQGEPPFDLVYSDGEKEYTKENINTKRDTLFVKPEYTTSYFPVSVSNFVGNGEVSSELATVNVFAIKDEFANSFDAYIHEHNSSSIYDTEPVVAFKSSTDGYQRRAFIAFDLTNSDLNDSSEDEFFISYSLVYSHHDLANSFVLEGTEELVDNSLCWKNQPAEESYSHIHTTINQAYGIDKDENTLIRKFDINATDFVKELLDKGVKKFSLRLTCLEKNAYYVKIGSMRHDNEDFRPKLMIKGQVYKE
ncbi:Protein of unknown function [Mariniphaga anaerophila]|uniref:DUF3823 domain-containing protein n=1 Tax=Mariniphaga anaerophila TaxID=1484053 RepID=A0A1M5FJZ4_9BACT|nr:DUF3823 domain-containing protein [Mariniphaga anaerophila]SHF91774.1 Protein of unknown function [Mariniphaga anaerophila]